jgi:large subunit ribosomal protein L29
MARDKTLHELDDDVLAQRLEEAKDELFKLRFSHATGQLDNTARLGEAKRQIARIHTLLREREIAAAEALAKQEQH